MKKWWNCSKEEKIERWEQARRVLLNLSEHEREHHFNMTDWGVITECGTVACAAGHCGMDPWFIERGLKLEPESLAEATRLFGNGKFEQEHPESTDRIVVNFFGHNGCMDIFFKHYLKYDQVIDLMNKHIETLKGITT